MCALCAVELVCCGVGAGRRSVGGWIVDFGGFAVGTGVDAVPEIEDEGGGCGEDYVAGRGVLVGWENGRWCRKEGRKCMCIPVIGIESDGNHSGLLSCLFTGGMCCFVRNTYRIIYRVVCRS